jgi:hypothetical protein
LILPEPNSSIETNAYRFNDNPQTLALRQHWSMSIRFSTVCEGTRMNLTDVTNADHLDPFVITSPLICRDVVCESRMERTVLWEEQMKEMQFWPRSVTVLCVPSTRHHAHVSCMLSHQTTIGLVHCQQNQVWLTLKGV